MTINAMQKVKSLRSFSELLKFFKVNNEKFLYFNNKICIIKIFCLMTSFECLLILLQVFNLIGYLLIYYIVLLIKHKIVISSWISLLPQIDYYFSV